MDIAKAKRRENIAEYILYLWQIEDLLRALQFSPEAIYSQLIAPRGIEEGQRHNYLLWYMDIANLLREPELPRLRAVLGREMSDIELCFRALYAAMLYRIKGEGGKSAVSDTIEYVSPVIAELADMYGKVERGEADLFKDTAPER